MDRGIRIPEDRREEKSVQGKNYLFAIGIDQYKHWQPLNNAVKDAKDVIGLLTQQYQFEPDDVFTLFDEDATEANIYNTIRTLKRNITDQDNLIVYYSGHGHYDEDFDEGFWVPVDAQTSTEDRYISNANIINKINAIDSHHTLLVVDSCFSGTLVVRKRSGIADERFKSRRILASGRQETVTDGRPGENSPFAAGIITYLKKNTSKSVNTTSLVQYVKDYMQGKARQTPVEGRIQNSSDEGGEFVFHLKMSETDMWKSVQVMATKEAFENYLDYYPNGQFAALANRKVLELAEDDIWQSARNKNTEIAFENYLKKYAPYGKYVSEAKENLQRLQAERDKRRELLQELTEKASERDKLKEKYDTLIQEAERHFNNRQLQKAQLGYREAQTFYLDGFTPNLEYLDEQLNFCSNGLRFLEYYEKGKNAMDKGNYRLALQYFNEARKIDDNPKMEDLVRYCRQKLEGKTDSPIMEDTVYGQSEPRSSTTQRTTKTTYKPRPQSAPVKKKRNGMKWFLGITGVLVGFLLIIALVQESQYDDYDGLDDSVTTNDYTPLEPEVPVNHNTTNDYAQLIQGTWQVTGMQYQQTGHSIPYSGHQMSPFWRAQFSFNANATGSIYYTTGASEQFGYTLTENAINWSGTGGGWGSGYITYHDGNTMQMNLGGVMVTFKR